MSKHRPENHKVSLYILKLLDGLHIILGTILRTVNDICQFRYKNLLSVQRESP